MLEIEHIARSSVYVSLLSLCLMSRLITGEENISSNGEHRRK